MLLDYTSITNMTCIMSSNVHFAKYVILRIAQTNRTDDFKSISQTSKYATNASGYSYIILCRPCYTFYLAMLFS